MAIGSTASESLGISIVLLFEQKCHLRRRDVRFFWRLFPRKLDCVLSSENWFEGLFWDKIVLGVFLGRKVHRSGWCVIASWHPRWHSANEFLSKECNDWSRAKVLKRALMNPDTHPALRCCNNAGLRCHDALSWCELQGNNLEMHF